MAGLGGFGVFFGFLAGKLFLHILLMKKDLRIFSVGTAHPTGFFGIGFAIVVLSLWSLDFRLEGLDSRLRGNDTLK